MTIENLDLLISAAPDARYEVRVIDSPQGRTDGAAPFPLTYRAGHLEYAGARIPATIDEVVDVEQTGMALYLALTSDDRVQTIMNTVLATYGSVRLRVQVEPKELRRLPWEVLYRDPDGFLALSQSIARYIAVGGQRIRSLLTQPPLKILIVSAAPRSLPALDSAAEIGRIRAALRDEIAAGTVELIECPNSPIETVRDIARDEHIHVLHFIGHGEFDERTPALAFADAQRNLVPVTAEVFAANLAGIDSLRLVVLNACDTAIQSTSASLVGIAPSLIQRAGLPAVLAMQTRILDRSAVAFSAGFYGELARGGQLDDALREARLRLFNRNSTQPRHAREFVVPVLFLRPADARLIDFPRPPIHNLVDRQIDPPRHDWRARIDTMAALYNRIAAWKAVHDALQDIDLTYDLVARQLDRLDRMDGAALSTMGPLSDTLLLRIDRLIVLGSDPTSPILTTPFAEGPDGTLTGDPWVVEIAAASRLFERALAANDLRRARAAARDLRRAIGTHLNTSDKGMADSLTDFPQESIWTDGAPTPALRDLSAAINAGHVQLRTALHLHDLLQDVIDLFRRVRDETRSAAARWNLDAIERAWGFLRTSVLDSQLRPYAVANQLLVRAPDNSRSGAAWAVDVFAAADRVESALDAAFESDQPDLLAEPLRHFDQTLRRHFFMIDLDLRELTLALRQQGVQLLALVEANP